MTTEIVTVDTLAIQYGVTADQIDLKRTTYAAIDVAQPGGYEACRLAIADCRETRVAVEAKRKELKAGALEYGRKVDAAANLFKAALEEIEEPLKIKKASIDDAKALAKAAKEAAEKAALEAQIEAERAAEAARVKAAQDAENARLAAIAKEQEEERARLAAERAKLEADRKAQEDRQHVAREQEEARLAATRKEEEDRAAKARAEIEAERQALEVAKAIEQARKDEVARAEAARIAAEQARVEEAERQALLRARLDALKPDAERLHQYASEIRALPIPRVTNEEARVAVAAAVDDLAEVAARLERFGNVEEVAA